MNSIRCDTCHRVVLFTPEAFPILATLSPDSQMAYTKGYMCAFANAHKGHNPHGVAINIDEGAPTDEPIN